MRINSEKNGVGRPSRSRDIQKVHKFHEAGRQGDFADTSVIPHIRTLVFDFRREVKSISSVLANVVKSPGFKVL